MPNDFVPPTDPEERAIEIALDAWVGYCRTVLWFCGLVYIALGLTLGPLAGLPLLGDPNNRTMGIVLTVVYTLASLVVGGGLGLVNVIAASALGRGKKWGWYLTVALGALYLPSACCLFGAVLLYGTLNDKTRKLFLSP